MRKRIGVFFDWPEAGPYHNSLLKGINSAAIERDFDVLVFANRGARPEQSISENSGRLMFDYVGAECIDGLVVTTGQEFLTENGLSDHGIPIVSIGQPIEGFPSVLTDSAPGFNALLEHLFAYHGYSNPVMVSGYKLIRDSIERVVLFNAALSRHGLPVSEDRIFHGSFIVEDGEPAVRYFYDDLGMKPDVIVCANDGMAIGVSRALARRGMRVPGDVAVTGFDDMRISPWYDGPLTTVKRDVVASGRKAVEMLAEYMGHRPRDAEVYYQKTEFIRRGSCGCDPGDSGNIPRSQMEEEALEAYIERNREVLGERVMDGFCTDIAKDLSLGGHAGSEALLLANLGIDSIYLTTYDGGNPSLEGSSRLMFAWIDGARAEAPIGGIPFSTRAILPEGMFPARRSTLIAEVLSYGEEAYGLLWMPYGAIGNNIYDGFRVRLSGAIREIKTTLRLKELNAELEEVRVRLEELSITDELTGHYNRRGFMAIANQQMSYCRRQGEGFWILYIDLDGLKSINDHYSHEEGDVAIRTFGQAIRSAFRVSDVIARLGGDEFTVMTPSAPVEILGFLIERLRIAVAVANRELAREWKLLMSIGAFYSDPKCDLGLEEMMNRADQQLYAEKRRKKRLASGGDDRSEIKH